MLSLTLLTKQDLKCSNLLSKNCSDHDFIRGWSPTFSKFVLPFCVLLCPLPLIEKKKTMKRIVCKKLRMNLLSLIRGRRTTVGLQGN